MHPQSPRPPALDPNKSSAQDLQHLPSSFPTASLCGFGCALYPPGHMSNTSCLSQFPDGFCWNVSCHYKNHKGWSSCKLGCHWGNVSRAPTSSAGLGHPKPRASLGMGWDQHSTPKSRCIEAPPPCVMVFRARTFGRWLGSAGLMRTESHDLCLQADTLRKGHEGTWGEGGRLQARNRAVPRTQPHQHPLPEF